MGRAYLLLPAVDDELQQAVALTERAVAGGPRGHEFAYPYYVFAQSLALPLKGTTTLRDKSADFCRRPSLPADAIPSRENYD